MVTKMIGALLRATTLITACFVFGLGHPLALGAADSILDRPVAAFSSNDELALHAILRFGRESNIPLGLVVNDQLCSAVLTDLKAERVSAQTLLDEFAKRLRSKSQKTPSRVRQCTPG
jgi:hypothetical protein